MAEVIDIRSKAQPHPLEAVSPTEDPRVTRLFERLDWLYEKVKEGEALTLFYVCETKDGFYAYQIDHAMNVFAVIGALDYMKDKLKADIATKS